MDHQTLIYLKDQFRKYYSSNRIPAPEQVKAREFGVGTLTKKIAIRHKKFSTEGEFNNFLRLEAPFYVSYSSAYYEFPDQSMEHKNWLGSDLVFDVDVHGFCIESLDQAKLETQNLIELLYDLGFKKQELRVNFSGNKGYHVHTSKEVILQMGKDSRREVYDFVCGIGLDLRTNSNWRRNIQACLIKFLTSSTIGDFTAIGVSEKSAEKILAKKEALISHIKNGELVDVDCIGEKTLEKFINLSCIHRNLHIDSSVTPEVGKLIRVPDSLNGSTGLLAKKIHDLTKFNPLVDAFAFDSEPVEVEGVHSFTLDKLYDVNGMCSLPKYAAVFSLLSQKTILKQNG